MSIWTSVPGHDPVIFDAEEGEHAISDGWFDVATTWGNLVRLIVQDQDGSAAICLTPEAVAELHRRITIARRA